MQKIFNIIDNNFDEYKKFLIDICMLESPSADKESVDKVCNYIAEFCTEKGFGIKKNFFENAGNGLVVSMNSESTLPGIAFMAHMDTVHEKGIFGSRIVREQDGYIYAPGVYDCKGGIAVALLVMNALKQINYKERPIKLILTGDEEVSTKLSGQAGIDFICNETRGFAAAFNCESGYDDGRIVVGRKGIIRLRIDIKGKAAHSGCSYNEGISAIKEAAHKIIEIERKSCFENITYNCGMISGGTGPNTVPEFCSFVIDIRFKSASDIKSAIQHIEKIVNTSYIEGTSATITEISKRLAMEQTDENMKLFKLYKNASEKYDFQKVTPFFDGGGADSAYSVLAGVPSVCAVGIVGDGCHTLNERAKIISLSERAKMLIGTVLDIPKGFAN